MNKDELTTIVRKEVDKFKGEEYASLKAWVDSHRTEAIEITDDTGNTYQIELSATWDDKGDRSIRFWGCLSRSGTALRSLFTRDIVCTFIKKIDGGVVD